MKGLFTDVLTGLWEPTRAAETPQGQGREWQEERQASPAGAGDVGRGTRHFQKLASLVIPRPFISPLISYCPNLTGSLRPLRAGDPFIQYTPAGLPGPRAGAEEWWLALGGQMEDATHISQTHSPTQ